MIHSSMGFAAVANDEYEDPDQRFDGLPKVLGRCRCHGSFLGVPQASVM